MKETAGPFSRWNADVAGGLVLVALALFAFISNKSLDMGTLGRMGPGMLPQILAVMLGLSGLLLLGFGIARQPVPAAEKEERTTSAWRGPVMVTLAIFAFALTLRPINLGFIATPGLGLLIAGPLGIILAGYASHEARLRELVLVSLFLTPFCIELFGDALNLPIPLYPEALRSAFPAGWSSHGIMRAISGALLVAGCVVMAPSFFMRKATRNV